MNREKVQDSAHKEFEQTHKRGALQPVDPKMMTQEESSKVIRSMLLTKQKSSGTHKSRAVADGSKQRGSADDEDKASPTASLRAILLTAIIEAQEERDVATVDTPNAFLHSELSEEDQVTMRLHGEVAETLVKLAPEIYRSHIVTERGKKALHVRLKKALYGLLKSALLFYEKLSKDSIDEGFAIDPHDRC